MMAAAGLILGSVALSQRTKVEPAANVAASDSA